MRLKRVRLFGFKTFADRSEFSLDGGVVAVIGPNGCGKSNLVDAILWGLGEGNARHLRAQTGQDVIFSGSGRRKALGFAEVSLLFDNEDRSLPLDAAEVMVSRRVTRGGDSDYAINRQACRLRDVHDLLADSGLGRAGYSIVGQKEIDAAVSASAEDRRAWIDEAAGVQRYRTRKVESLRRLEQANEHLARVLDILTELEGQREPMRQDAEVALRYRSVLSSLREVELGQLVSEAARAIRDLREAEIRIEETHRKGLAESSAADQFEEEASKLAKQIGDLDAKIEAIRQRQQSALTAEERVSAQLLVSQERLKSLSDQEYSLNEDAAESAKRRAEAEAELAALQVDAEAETAALASLQTEVGGQTEATRGLQANLKALDRELADARDRQARRLRQDAERAQKTERRVHAQRELKGIEHGASDLETAIAEAETALTEAAGALEAIQAKSREAQEQLVQHQNAERELSREMANTRSSIGSAEGRIRGIEATIDAHEGLTQGSRAVLEAIDKGKLTGSYTAVGNAIITDPRFAVAIETALGAAANDLICDSADDAKRAIAWLKEQRAGRATFQPLDLMHPGSPSAELREASAKPGMVGLASELVEAEPRFRPVIDSLLGRILVAETIDQALKWNRTRGWSRIVTLDGEVLHSGGAVTGGHQNHRSYGLVQRRADLAALKDQLRELSRTLAEQEKQIEARRAQQALLLSFIASEVPRHAEAALLRDEAAQLHQTLRNEQRAGMRQGDRLREEIATLEREEEPLIEVPDIQAVERQRDAALTALAAQASDAEQAELRLRERRTQVQATRARVEGAVRRLQTLHDQELNRGRRIERLGPERDRILAQIAADELEQAASHQRRLDAESEIFVAQRERMERVAANERAIADARTSRQNAVALADLAHQAELRRARAESRRANALERLYEDYGLTEADAMDQADQHEVPPDAVSLINRLRRELKSMGDVNLGSIEAYERLTARLDELGAQRTDILEGIDQVNAGIRELDKLTRHKFTSTFEAVRVAFEGIFQKLFNGGDGTIQLSNPDNILETGVELAVQLPGKKRQPLALLSGGERSLCASAFLFALLEVKPSPLVVLDEVDAPLDGANVERFAALLREFSTNTQFIVITHNPSTIATIPTWLGVSMQEPGVSVLLPTSLPAKVPVEDQSELEFSSQVIG